MGWVKPSSASLTFAKWGVFFPAVLPHFLQGQNEDQNNTGFDVVPRQLHKEKKTGNLRQFGMFGGQFHQLSQICR